MITAIARTAVTLIASVGLACAQGLMADQIEGFEGSLGEQFAQSCRSVQIFTYDVRESDVVFVPALTGVTSSSKRIVDHRAYGRVEWAGSPSEERCIQAHRQLLASLPQDSRDRMYRSRYNEAMETCLRTLRMPARADSCEGFASDAARRTHLRDYILRSLTGAACADLLNTDGQRSLRLGFCVSFEMPPGEEEQWKTFLSKILARGLQRGKDAQSCLPLEAQAIARLTRVGFDCASTSSAAENHPTSCRRSFERHDFSSLDQPGAVKASRETTRMIEIVGSATGELRDVCARMVR